MRHKVKTTVFVLGCSLIGISLGLAIAQQIDDDGPPIESPPNEIDPVDLGPPVVEETPPPDAPAISGIKSSKRRQKVTARAVANPAALANAARDQQMNTYVGTSLAVNEGLGNENIQKQIVSAFARLDPKVPDRVNHFAWVSKVPELNPVGWRGQITSMKRVPAGILVEVQITPQFAPAGGVVISHDQCTEQWLYRAGGLTFFPVPHKHRPAALMQD